RNDAGQIESNQTTQPAHNDDRVRGAAEPGRIPPRATTTPYESAACFQSAGLFDPRMGKMIRDPTVPVQPERLPSGEVAPAASALAELPSRRERRGARQSRKPPVAQWIEQRVSQPAPTE